jgi:hypothetical protein
MKKTITSEVTRIMSDHKNNASLKIKEQAYLNQLTTGLISKKNHAKLHIYKNNIIMCDQKSKRLTIQKFNSNYNDPQIALGYCCSCFWNMLQEFVEIKIKSNYNNHD